MTESSQPEKINIPALKRAKENLLRIEEGGSREAQQTYAQLAQAYALVSIAESLASLDNHGIKVFE